MDLDELVLPDTAAAVAANQVARRYCSSALYSHSVRTYLWGAAYAVRGGVDVDRELFYVAAMLHDIGLTRPFDAHLMPFEDAGGEVAWVVGAASGWTDDRRTRVARVIGKHTRPSVNPREDAEGHLLQIAVGIDISGRGLDVIPVELQTEVVAAWPRLDLAVEFVECLRVQGERKPTSRAADFARGGLADALLNHPLDRRPPS